MAVQFLDDDDNLADLADRIPGHGRDIYKSYKALKIEAAFDDRIFVLYKPTGLTERNEHRDPEILTTVRLIDLRLSSTDGIIRAMDENNGEVTEVGYVPERLFGYDVVISIPPRLTLKWDARIVDGVVRRSLSYPVLIKTRTRGDWYSAGVTGMETPNNFRKLFPKVQVNFF